MNPATTPTTQTSARDAFGGRLFITLEETAVLFGVSPRTARRWAADYLASGGTRGIPVMQITARRRLVPVRLLPGFRPGDKGARD